jgi:hypothetical protein
MSNSPAQVFLCLLPQPWRQRQSKENRGATGNDLFPVQFVVL